MELLNEQTADFIAKTDPDSAEYWLPLWMHAKDASGVMRKLVKYWISNSIFKATGMDALQFEKTAVFLAYVHDIGKATSRFQSVITMKLPEMRERLLDQGYRVLNPKEYVYPGGTPHAHAGQWILMDERIEHNIDSSVANIVGAHHGRPIDSLGLYNTSLIEEYPQNFFGGKDINIWFSFWNQFVKSALDEADLSSTNDLGKITVQGQVLLSGLLIVADWIASNSYYFPLIPRDEYGSMDMYPKRVDEAYDDLRFPEIWESGFHNMTPNSFTHLFGFEPNEVQKSFIEIVNHVREPGIYVLEAQMGIGKTEAALAAADILSERFGNRGLFFGLPSQATSNGIFPRILEWAEAESTDTLLTIKLAHGAAELNEEYDKFMFSGHAQIDEDYDSEYAGLAVAEDAGISVHPWFEGSKKSLLSNFVIGTVDQFLMSALARKHFMLRHIGLAGKVVIIDECHAYDAYMNQFLDRALEWMAAYKVPVILLSATLPSERRMKLINSYENAYKKYSASGTEQQKQSDTVDWEHSIGYPLLTWTDGTNIHQRMIKQTIKERKVLFSRIMGIDSITGLLNDRLKYGGCACIIMNTVKAAQQVYDEITNDPTFQDYEVLLYHAQFTMPDRAGKEKAIIERMGKTSTVSQRNRFILVGTQVLEQSLDYDADVMITQVCPMDLLLQRIGRLHRHVRNDRPEHLRSAECVLLVESDGEYDKGSSAVYGDWLLMRTIATVPAHMSIPGDIPELVQKVYDFSNDLGLDSEEYFKAKEKYENSINNKEHKAVYRLPKPDKRKGLKGILSNIDLNSDAHAEAKVRDGAGSLEVFLMIGGEDRKASFLPGHHDGVFVDKDQIPDSTQGKLIAKEMIRLPHALCAPWNIDGAIRDLEEMNRREAPEWQNSPWIKGELVLFLNHDLKAMINGFEISYSNERGLSYEKTDS